MTINEVNSTIIDILETLGFACNLNNNTIKARPLDYTEYYSDCSLTVSCFFVDKDQKFFNIGAEGDNGKTINNITKNPIDKNISRNNLKLLLKGMINHIIKDLTK